MRRLGLVVLVVVFAGLASGARAEMAGNVQFLVGQRWLEDDQWSPIDEPPIFGVEVDFAPKDSPIRVALAAIMSGESKSGSDPFFGVPGDAQAGFFEISAGFLWHPVKKAIVRPYLGAGVLTMGATIDDDFGAFVSDDIDQSFGFYGNVGVFFKVGESFNIGVDGRIVRGTDLEFRGLEVNGDYEQVGLLIGFSWGE